MRGLSFRAYGHQQALRFISSPSSSSNIATTTTTTTTWLQFCSSCRSSSSLTSGGSGGQDRFSVEAERQAQSPSERERAEDKVGKPGAKKKKRRKRKKKSDVFTGRVEAIPEGFSDWIQVREEVRAKAKELGLGPTHFARVEVPRRERWEAYLRWLEKGMHGEMAYLARDDRLLRRRDPSFVLEGCRSIIVSSLFYWPGKSGFKIVDKMSVHTREKERERGQVSCYAWGDDYHVILGEKLKALATFAGELCGGNARWYVDTGAVLERDVAEKSGLSFTGKNTMAIHPRYGSGFFLGSVFSTLPLPPDEPLKKSSYCGSCNKCQVHCPTGALHPSKDYVMDARKCISYLTIELKGSIPEELRPLMGTWIYGCDICQQVCPWNKFDWEGKTSPLWGSVPEQVSFPVLRDLLRITDEEFTQRFATTAVKRIGREQFLRNVATALGNSGDERAIEALEKAIEKETSSLIKEHCQWAIRRIMNVNQKDQDINHKTINNVK